MLYLVLGGKGLLRWLLAVCSALVGKIKAIRLFLAAEDSLEAAAWTHDQVGGVTMVTRIHQVVGGESRHDCSGRTAIGVLGHCFCQCIDEWRGRTLIVQVLNVRGEATAEDPWVYTVIVPATDTVGHHDELLVTRNQVGILAIFVPFLKLRAVEARCLKVGELRLGPARTLLISLVGHVKG